MFSGLPAPALFLRGTVAAAVIPLPAWGLRASPIGSPTAPGFA